MAETSELRASVNLLYFLKKMAAEIFVIFETNYKDDGMSETKINEWFFPL